MRRTFYHTTVTILIAGVFIIVSSGFTTTVHICRFDNRQVESEMSCCSSAVEMQGSSCDSHALSAHKPISFEGNNPCHVNKVVGGLADLQALLQKSHTIDSDKSITLCATVAAINPHSGQPHGMLAEFLRSSVTSPPSVEKYVLFSSLLI